MVSGGEVSYQVSYHPVIRQDTKMAPTGYSLTVDRFLEDLKTEMAKFCEGSNA